MKLESKVRLYSKNFIILTLTEMTKIATIPQKSDDFLVKNVMPSICYCIKFSDKIGIFVKNGTNRTLDNLHTFCNPSRPHALVVHGH